MHINLYFVECKTIKESGLRATDLARMQSQCIKIGDGMPSKDQACRLGTRGTSYPALPPGTCEGQAWHDSDGAHHGTRRRPGRLKIRNLLRELMSFLNWTKFEGHLDTTKNNPFQKITYFPKKIMNTYFCIYFVHIFVHIWGPVAQNTLQNWSEHAS